MLVQTIKSIRSFLSSGLGMLIFTCLFALSVVRIGLAEEAIHSEKTSETAEKAEGLEPLIKTLENAEMREALIMKIKALQGLQEKKSEAPKGFLDSAIFAITQQSMIVTEALVSMGPAVEKIPLQFIMFFEKFSTHHLKGVLSSIILLGLAILIGFLFEKGCRILFTEIRKKSTHGVATSVVSQHAFLLTHIFAHLIPIFVFYVVSVSFIYSALIFFRQGSLVQMQAISDGLGIAVLHILLSIFVYRGCMTVANVTLSPKASDVRYLQITDQKANHMFNFLGSMLMFAVVGFGVSNITEVLGLEVEPRILWSRIVGLVTTIMAINFVFHYRADVSNWLRSEIEENDARSSAMREILVFISDIWHLLATIALLSIFVAWSINPETGHTYLIRCVTFSALTIMAVRIAHIIIVKLIRLLAGKSKSDIQPGQTSEMPHLDALLHGITHFTAFVLLLNIWGIDLGELSRTKGGSMVIGHGLAIVVISFLSVLVWEIINRLIEDALRPMTVGGKLVQPSSRIKTFMPIVRNVLKWFIITLALVVILAQLGINVTTLLAGLGVIGLAVAMGSQKLAQDVVTGVFILMENSIEVGDVVNVGGVSGEVVSFTIRTILLRNISGELHTVPYSAIGTVTNLSKDYSNCIMEVSVGHDANIATVTSLFEKVGAEMYADQEFAPKVLSELKVIGVSKLTDTSTNIMSIMKTEPDPYHVVDQEFRRRLKLEFAEMGIQVPAIRQVVSFQTKDKGSSLKVAIEQ